MSNPSLFRTLWRKFWNPTGFVGRDLEGNSYYEWSNPLKSAGYARPKRSVKYRNPDDMWNYIGGSKRLPIQWSAWLAHTRPNPPSIQELQKDFIRQHRVQHKAALLEASFQQERAQLQIAEKNALQNSSDIPPSQNQDTSSMSPSNIATSPSMSSVPPEVSPVPSLEPVSGALSPPPGSSLPKTGSDEYQPESWTPKLRVRRG